jgi:hypothetical protein
MFESFLTTESALSSFAAIGFLNVKILSQYRFQTAFIELCRVDVWRQLERIIQLRWDRSPNFQIVQNFQAVLSLVIAEYSSHSDQANRDVKAG